MNLPIFNHALYGRCLLLPNQSFIVSDKPNFINYVLLGTPEESLEVKSSSIHDAGLDGLTPNREILSRLRDLGY